MRILFLGDIFGRPGRRVVEKVLPGVVKKMKIDLVIANAENLAGGKGVNKKTIKEMRSAGVHVFTGGNHSFENFEGNEVYDIPELAVLRPANFPPETPGRGWGIFVSGTGKKLLVITVLGRTFMPQHVDCPFRTVERILKKVSEEDYDASLVDFHAEATSEKQAMLWYLNGRVSAVIGTHTHVATADAEVTPEGTAFQADAGMNGSLDSCIGLKKESVLQKLLLQMPLKFDVEDSGRMHFSAVFVEVGKGGNAKKIEYVRRVLE